MALFKTQSVDALDKTRGSPGYRRSASVIVAPSSGGLSLAAAGGPAPRANVPSWYRNLHQTLRADDERSASLDDLDDDSHLELSAAPSVAKRNVGYAMKPRSESVDLGSYNRSKMALSARGRPNTTLNEINEEIKGVMSSPTTMTGSKSAGHVTGGAAGIGATCQQQSQQHQPRLIDIDHRPSNDAPARQQTPPSSPASAAATVSHREVATEAALDDEDDVIDADQTDTDDEVNLVDNTDELSEAEKPQENNIRRRTTVCDKDVQVDDGLDSTSLLSLPPLPRSPPPPLPPSLPPPEPHQQPSDADISTTDRQVETEDARLLIGRDATTVTQTAKAVTAEAPSTRESRQRESLSAAPVIDHDVDHPSTIPTPRPRSSVTSTSTPPSAYSTSGSDDVLSCRRQSEKKKFVPGFATGGSANFTAAFGDRRSTVVNGASGGGTSRQSSVQSSNKDDWRRREAVTSAPLGLQVQIPLGSTTDKQRQQQQQQQQRQGSTSCDFAETSPTDDKKFRLDKPPNGRAKKLIADDEDGKFLRCRSLETIPSETSGRRLLIEDIDVTARGGEAGSGGIVAETGTRDSRMCSSGNGSGGGGGVERIKEVSGGRPRSSSDGLDSRLSRDLTLATTNSSSSSSSSNRAGNSRHQQTPALVNNEPMPAPYNKQAAVTVQPPPPTDRVTNGGRPTTNASTVEVKSSSTAAPTALTNSSSVRRSDEMTTTNIDGKQSTTSSSSFVVKSQQKSSIAQEATLNKKQYKWTVHESTPLSRPRTAGATKPSSAITSSSSRKPATLRPSQATTRADIGSAATHNATPSLTRKDDLLQDAKPIRTYQNDAISTSGSTRKQAETPKLTFSAYNGRHDTAVRPTNVASVQQSAAAAAEPGGQQNAVSASTGRMRSALAKFRSMESLVASTPTPVPIAISAAGTTAAHRPAHIANNVDRASRNTGTGTGKPNVTGCGNNRGLDGSGTARAAAATTVTKFRSMENIDGGTTFGVAGSPAQVENSELCQIDARKMTGLGSEQIRQKEARLENGSPVDATERRQQTPTQLFKYRSMEDVLAPTTASAIPERLKVANGDCQAPGKAATNLTLQSQRAAEKPIKVANKSETKYATADEANQVAKQPEIVSVAQENSRVIPGNSVTNSMKMSLNDNDTDTDTTTDDPATAQQRESEVTSRYSFIPKYQSMEDIVTDLPRIGRPLRWQKAAPTGGQQQLSASARRSFSVGDVSGGRQQDDAVDSLDGRGFRSALNSVDGGGSFNSWADCNGGEATSEVMGGAAPWNDGVDDQMEAERAAANRDVVKSCLFIKLQTTEHKTDEVAAAAAATAATTTTTTTIRIVSVRRQN